jgi:ribosome-associated protein
MEDLIIHPNITIDSSYLSVSYSRSSGPGGQHVNKLNTKVTVFLDVRNCPAFNERQKNTLENAFPGRMDKHGVLRVSSQRFRSQAANQNAALERLASLIEAALKPKRIRKKTKIPKYVKEKRIRDKKFKSAIKKLRSKMPDLD